MFQDLTQTFEESAPRAAGADDREIFAQWRRGEGAASVQSVAAKVCQGGTVPGAS